MATKRAILGKTLQVSGYTLLSRILGVIREVVMVRYLGVTALSDAFVTAFKIPNSLRKIFAEGALSAAFVPTIVQTMRTDGKTSVNRLMTLGFLLFEGTVLIICAIAMLYAPAIIEMSAPGFSADQAVHASRLLIFLMPFIFFVSSSALFAGALQAAEHFFIPAISPVILNIVFIATLLSCLYWQLPVDYLCIGILVGGLLQLLLHAYYYNKLHFGFARADSKDLARFGWIVLKFLSCLMSMSIMEIGLFFDSRFASYLSKGSVTIIYYANRFMGIPLGVFAVALSVTLLPHFSRIGAYAPKRLSFYLLETAKLIWFVLAPVTIIMIVLSRQFFITIFLSEKFTIEHVNQAAPVLSGFCIGLFFFSLNKIMLNMFYAVHRTALPAAIAAAATLINIGLNSLLMPLLQTTGIAFATTIAASVQAFALLAALSYQLDLRIYLHAFAQFVMRASVQLALLLIPFGALFAIITKGINALPAHYAHLLNSTILFWFWVGPLCIALAAALACTRDIFKVRLFFLD